MIAEYGSLFTVVKYQMNKPTIVVTLGDPAGIGPEIVKKAVRNKSVLKICNPMVIGNSENFTCGKPSHRSGSAAISFLVKALDFVYHGKCCHNTSVGAVVTAPVTKNAFTPFGVGGHTEFLAKKTDSKNVEMLMIAGDKKVLLITRHIPIRDVSKNISKAKIVKSTLLICDFLKEKYNIIKPHIIVCGLNPHCSDNGLVGNEENREIIPAINILTKSGFDVLGPVNPEVAFRAKSDLIVCMYHDQAMLPLKILKPNEIVNVTVGLPFIRTSPGHGTAFDIAGKNKANPRPMIEAIKLAAYLAKGNCQCGNG